VCGRSSNRMREEDEAKRMLADLEKVDRRRLRSTGCWPQCHTAVLEHAVREEQEELSTGDRRTGRRRAGATRNDPAQG
jgi:hypothetical protein